jgi:response regulator of citrate/malate metabolism
MQAMQTLPNPRRAVAGQNCLIVEDSAFDSEKLTRVIHNIKTNLVVEVASTLRAARDALEKGKPRLILLDNNLPDGLGTNFALELSRDPKFSDIPIILVSDWPSPFMWEKAATAGVAYVLSKMKFDARYVRAALSGQKANRLN